MFLSRLAKGPPPQFRWLAWRFIASRLKLRVTGDYEKNLYMGRQDSNVCRHDIKKDIDRTFPEFSYFKSSEFGSYGLAQLQNVLDAYSVYKPEVGYCQSMNFLAAFLLLNSGGNEK